MSQTKATIPDYVISTVNKMLNCRNPQKLGYHKYACKEHPDEFVVVPHSCKTRFCNTCGKISTDNWIVKIENDFPQTSFHHICFTVPDTLRQLIFEHKFLLNCLFRCLCKNDPLIF